MQKGAHKRSTFSGKLGFVLSAAGASVGLGNIWRFPYLAAKYGGGIFLLVYIILALTFGTLTGSGSCQVTQTFTLEISGAQTQLRFPLSPGAKKASVAGYDAQKQTDGDCPVLVLTDANGFTGSRSFTVMYTISGLASEPVSS